MDGISKGQLALADNVSKYLAHSMIMKFAVSMTLKAALQLGIPDILANAEGKKPLSAAEILAQLPTKSTPGPTSSINLRRLLNPLVREGIFSESFDGHQQPVYGLTDVSKWFVTDNELNMTPMADLQLSSVSLGSWNHLQELILDETIDPFIQAQGIPYYEYCRTKEPEHEARIQAAMVSLTKFQKNELMEALQQRGVLDGVNTLVDVGGGLGATVGEIVARNPHITGVNFDMPSVIDTAPAIKGVQHVRGSFFDAVPAGDTMFLKFVIHNYGDEEATKIVENCFKALPKGGKIILAENVLTDSEQDTSTHATFIQNIDLSMLSKFKGARERTMKEYQKMLLAAGFSRSNLIQSSGCLNLIEGFKE